MKRVHQIAIGILLLLLALGATFKLRITSDFTDEIRVLSSLPNNLQTSTIDLINADLHKLDLRNHRQIILNSADFDTRTIWPKLLPSRFEPKSILVEGKNPGLGVRQLHTEGVTGKGVSIGLIDQDLLINHVEYKGRIRLYEKIDAWNVPQMHGPAVTSIAAGKRVGVAPEADIYYFVIRMDQDRKCRNVARAIDRILELNKTLPKEKRISVVSISCWWKPGEKGFEQADAAAKRARDRGLLILSSVSHRYYNFCYYGLGRKPGDNPEVPSSYNASPSQRADSEQWYENRVNPNRIFVPMDSRTVASCLGTRSYTFYRVGGLSWCAPYIAGVYALAKQVNPNLTTDDFTTAAVTTSTFTMSSVNGKTVQFGPIINPPGIVEYIRQSLE